MSSTKSRSKIKVKQAVDVKKFEIIQGIEFAAIIDNANA